MIQTIAIYQLSMDTNKKLIEQIAIIKLLQSTTNECVIARKESMHVSMEL